MLPVLKGLIDTGKVLEELKGRQSKFEKQLINLEKKTSKKKGKTENSEENTNTMKNEIQMKLDKVKKTISDIENF